MVPASCPQHQQECVFTYVQRPQCVSARALRQEAGSYLIRSYEWASGLSADEPGTAAPRLRHSATSAYHADDGITCLSAAITLYISGVSPCAGTEALLPVLERVYITACADSDASDRFVRPRRAGVQYVRVRECTWTEGDIFEIYKGRSSKGELQWVSDAPFGYWAQPEDTDSDEDDSSDASE